MPETTFSNHATVACRRSLLLVTEQHSSMPQTAFSESTRMNTAVYYRPLSVTANMNTAVCCRPLFSDHMDSAVCFLVTRHMNIALRCRPHSVTTLWHTHYDHSRGTRCRSFSVTTLTTAQQHSTNCLEGSHASNNILPAV